MSETPPDNVIHVSAFGKKLISQKHEEQELKTLCFKIVSALFTRVGQDPDLAQIIVDQFTIDDLLKLPSMVAQFIAEIGNRSSEDLINTEVTPFESDPDRFMAWSLAATCLSPRSDPADVETSIREASDEDVQLYLQRVRGLSLAIL